MTGQRSELRTAFLLSASDFDRLQALIESPRYRASHAPSLIVLKEQLNRSETVSPAQVPREVVTMRSSVIVRDARSRETLQYTLVYPDEADIENGKVSVLAPLGLALLGKRVGELATFEAPLGTRRLKVESIEYQPESAGDLHL